MSEDGKRCPFCDELVRINAIKCRHCGSIISSDTGSTQNNPDTLIQQFLGATYDMQEVLGAGGMAVVYRAIQKNLQRAVALKVVHQNLIQEKEFIDRFLREARVGASLNHENIVTIYDVGSLGPIHYMAMEYLEGKTLRQIIKEEEKLSEDQTIRYNLPLANALSYLHKQNLVHRDIKSANVIITKNKPVLTDFGIVFVRGEDRLSQVGSVVGTPEYMSPEQAIGKTEVDHRADIYSLGVMLYECLTGTVPFHHSNPLTTVHSLLNDAPKEPKQHEKSIPDWLNGLVLDCMIKDPDKRIQDCTIIADALKTRTYKRGNTNAKGKNGKQPDPFSTIKLSSDQFSLQPSEKQKKPRRKTGLIISLVLLAVILAGASYFYFVAPPAFLSNSKQINANTVQAVSQNNPASAINQETQNSNNQPADIAGNQQADVLAGNAQNSGNSSPPSGSQDIKKTVLNDALTDSAHRASQDDSLKNVLAETFKREQEIREKAAAEERARIEAVATLKKEAEAKAKKAEDEKARIEAQRLAKIREAERSKLTDEQLVRLKGLGIDLVYIPAKTGNFYMGKYEVTQALWESVVGENPSVNKGSKNPVENVSKYDIIGFLTKLNQLTGLVFRLPTLDEWEFAAKANTDTKYSGGNLIEAVAWFEGNSDMKLQAVGLKQPNAFKLFDMSGNVAEMCVDGEIKGGSYLSTSNQCEISFSSTFAPDKKDWSVGFRLFLKHERP